MQIFQLVHDHPRLGVSYVHNMGFFLGVEL